MRKPWVLDVTLRGDPYALRASVNRMPRVRAVFAAEATSASTSTYRVGIWRVMAETSGSEAERAEWIGRIEQVLQPVRALGRVSDRFFHQLARRQQ